MESNFNIQLLISRGLWWQPRLVSTHSLKLLMGDPQEKPGTVNMCPFVGVEYSLAHSLTISSRFDLRALLSHCFSYEAIVTLTTMLQSYNEALLHC